MLTINSLKCLYDTGARVWAMELIFDGETATKRFDLDGPDDAEMLLEAFEESTASTFNPETGEIAFAYEYFVPDDEDEEDDEDESEGDEDAVSENDAEEDESGPEKKQIS